MTWQKKRVTNLEFSPACVKQIALEDMRRRRGLASQAAAGCAACIVSLLFTLPAASAALRWRSDLLSLRPADATTHDGALRAAFAFAQGFAKSSCPPLSSSAHTRMHERARSRLQGRRCTHSVLPRHPPRAAAKARTCPRAVAGADLDPPASLDASLRAASPLEALEDGHWVKIICGASNEDAPQIRNLALVYTLAGAE